MTILHLIIAWLAVFAGYLVWARIRENAQAGRRPWDFGYFNFLVGSFVFVILVWVAMLVFHPEPDLTSPDAQIRYGNATRQPWIANHGWSEKIDSAEDNIDLHFERVRNHFLQRDPDFSPPDAEEYLEEEARLYTYYTDLSLSPDKHLHDIGHVMLAYMDISSPVPDYMDAEQHLLFVDDRTTKYVNYVAGKIMMSNGGSAQAIEHFHSEIRNKGYKEGAYELLSVIYDYEGNDSALKAIIYSRIYFAVPEEIRARIYYQENDVMAFYSLKLDSMFRGMNFWGLSGGIAILFIWLFFLWSLTFASRISIPKLLIPVMAGLLFAMTAWWIYAFYKHGLGFWTNGEIVNDAVFSFAGIGLIEEVVKIIPFLLLLRFTRLVKKPIDYIVVASACGLGFAVFENLMYIANYGLDVIHSRALTSSLSHMACSGIVAYGFILRRYRWPNRWWLIPLFFIFATAAHGFYDFWLLNDKVHSFGLLTLFFFLTEIVVYISFINNAMNQSVEIGSEAPTGMFDARRMTSILAGGFVLLFGFEYLAICLVYGTKYGNSSITTAFLSGGYLIFFLSARMSQIKVEPGKWNRIDFLSGILPSQMFTRKEEEE